LVEFTNLKNVNSYFTNGPEDTHAVTAPVRQSTRYLRDTVEFITSFVFNVLKPMNGR
jgi:hypothetical protein